MKCFDRLLTYPYFSAYWLIENETKMVRLSKFEDGKEEILKDFEIKSERDEEHFDKLRKIQPRSESKFQINILLIILINY